MVNREGIQYDIARMDELHGICSRHGPSINATHWRYCEDE